MDILPLHPLCLHRVKERATMLHLVYRRTNVPHCHKNLMTYGCQVSSRTVVSAGAPVQCRYKRFLHCQSISCSYITSPTHCFILSTYRTLYERIKELLRFGSWPYGNLSRMSECFNPIRRIGDWAKKVLSGGKACNILALRI